MVYTRVVRCSEDKWSLGFWFILPFMNQTTRGQIYKKTKSKSNKGQNDKRTNLQKDKVKIKQRTKRQEEKFYKKTNSKSSKGRNDKRTTLQIRTKSKLNNRKTNH